jgi:hypothetical protein
MMRGREILSDLRRVSGATSEIYSYQSAKIKHSSLERGIHFYETGIRKFMGNSIIKRLEGQVFADDEALRARLRPETAVGMGEWVDIAGLIAPKTEIDRLLDGIESGEIDRLKGINTAFERMHTNYYTYEWTWVYSHIEDFYGIDPQRITAGDVVRIVGEWKEAVVGLDRLVYEDARKEFSLSSMTGFGADGSPHDMKRDFEQVRGDFENNPFVTEVLRHIEKKTALGDELIGRLSGIV